MKMLWTLSIVVVMTNSASVFAEIDATPDTQSYTAKAPLNPIGVFKRSALLAPLSEDGMYGSVGPRARIGSAAQPGRTLDGEDCEIVVRNMLVNGRSDFRSISLSIFVYKGSSKKGGVANMEVQDSISSEIWVDKDAQNFLGKLSDNTRTITLKEASSDSRGLTLETTEDRQSQKSSRQKVSVETKGSQITSATGQNNDEKEVTCLVGNVSS